MDNIEKYREDLQNIDSQLVQYFLARIEVATKIGKYKKKRNIPIFQAEQEERVLHRVTQLARTEQEKELLKSFFQCIMDLSKEVQK